MFDNHLYNLLNQLTQEHKSLWRIQKMYENDAQDCTACKEFWGKMKEDKEAHIAELKEMITSHM